MRADVRNASSLKLAPNSTTSLRPIFGTGPAGADGSNVLPTDTAIANAIANSASATRGAADDVYTSRYTRIDVVKDHGADNTGSASAVSAFNAAIAAANTAVGKVEIIVPPGTYNLTAGITTTISNSHVHVVGGGMGVSILNGGSGTLFEWNTAAIGGGLRDVSIVYASPDSASKALYINGASSQKFRNLFLDNVRQLVRLGESGALASAPSFRHIYGNTDPATGSVVIDAAFGTGLSLDDIIVNAKGVGFPNDTTSAHPANDTTFLRFGQGSWDTIHANSVISNRYNRGLDINCSTAVNVVNGWFKSCVFDYNKTHGIRLSTSNSGANIRSLYFMSGWAVATDNYSVEVAASAGTHKNIHFTDFVARQAGKCNWKFANATDVTLTSCHGLGANRLTSTNTGSDHDDLVILGSGVKVLGGMFGEDGSSYTGFTCQGRYGITAAADVAEYLIQGVIATGGTGDFQPITNTSGSKRRLVAHNRNLTGTPAYATTAGITAPTSNTLTTNMDAFVETFYVSGGTVTSIQVNGVQVGTTGPATLTLNPGDTYKIIYSVAPTVVKQVSP